MNRTFCFLIFSSVILFFTLFTFSCKKEDPKILPVLTTAEVSDISSDSAISGGEISSDGGAAVTSRGICWSTSPNPVITGDKVTRGSGTGSFTASLSGLLPGTTYYVRAWATNSVGTAYGNQVTFSVPAVMPTLTTAAVSGITGNSAISGGNITGNGGSAVTARGVCWSTTENPTVLNAKTTNGSGSGSFTSSLADLAGATTYYVRAWAENSAGIAYGNQVSFSTSAALPSIMTVAGNDILPNSAKSGGVISSDGGSAVTARGICWSISPNPTVANRKTNNGTGAGSYTSLLTGLSAGTSYYVRAYATNGAGTAYGDQIIVLTDGNYIQLRAATLGNGVDLVLIGDGYMASEITSGEYQNDMEEAMACFFDMEPYKTYAAYFNVYVVFAISDESGISNLTTTKDTKFNAKYNSASGSRMITDASTCFTYALYPPVSDLRETTIILVTNSARYAGTTYLYSSGEAVAICPKSTAKAPYDFRGIVQHEAGGHAFAKLADEYTNKEESITASDLADLQLWQNSYGYYQNVDVTSDLLTILWHHFIGQPDYSYVGAFEGGYYYTKGVWRPESNSLMVNNIQYMNAPGRELAVKRIMSLAGQAYSFDAFKLKDKMELTPATKGSGLDIDPSRLLPSPLLIQVR